MQEIKSEGAKVFVDGVEIEGFAEDESIKNKRVAIVGGRGQNKSLIAKAIADKGFGVGDRITKKEMLDVLKKALMASGHTKARATVLAKEHYKKYLGCQR